MADHPVEPHLAAWLKVLAPYVPGFAGAVMALAFLERLTARGRMVAVVVGLGAASFLGPALGDLVDLFWPGTMPKSIGGAVMFLTGLGAMGVLPPFLGWLKRVAGDPLNLLRLPLGSPRQVLVGDAAVPAPPQPKE